MNSSIARDSETDGTSFAITDEDAKRTYNGASYSSSENYLTATFFIPGKKNARKDMPKPVDRPDLEENTTVSIKPSGLPDLPEELTSFGAAIAGQKLFVYGGHTGSAHSYSTAEQSGRLWMLDLADRNPSWQQLANSTRLQGLALVPWGNNVVRIGGFTAMNEEGDEHDLRSQTSVAVFDTDAKSWSDLAPLPEPRSSLDAAVLDDKAYVVGGWHLNGGNEDSSWHTSAWSLDLTDASAKWQPIATPPFQRRALSLAAHNGKLFTIGGMNSNGGPTTEVSVYDPKNDAWTSGPSIPGSGMSGFGSSAFAVGDQLYVSAMDGFVHQLKDETDQWTTVAKSDPARFFHRMLPLNGNLLMIGGANMEIGKLTRIDLIELVRE